MTEVVFTVSLIAGLTAAIGIALTLVAIALGRVKV